MGYPFFSRRYELGFEPLLTKTPASSENQSVPGVEGIEVEKTDDESQRTELKTFLDQCQSEFMYLMITPANPLPPRESPPIPILEDLREAEAFGMPGAQLMERQYQLPMRQGPNHMQDMNSRQHPGPNSLQQQQQSKFISNAPEMQPQMVRSTNDHQQQSLFHNPNDWQQQQQQQQPISVTTRPVEDGLPRPNHSVESMGAVEESIELREKPPAAPDPEGWEFPDGSFPEPAAGHPPSQTSSYRSDTDAFPNADYLTKSPNRAPGPHRRKSSMSKRRNSDHDLLTGANQKAESGSFKLRFGLRGHLNTIRTVIFSGGGSPGEPEICTAGDDGMIKRFHIPRLDGNAATSNNAASDLDVTANFTHRGHASAILSLASWSLAPNFSTGGRAQGDGWIFSGGQDATVRVWERGRVDPKATLEGHTDAVWALCVLPTTLGAVFGNASNYGTPDRILLVSGAADGTVRLWSVSAPPQPTSPQPAPQRAQSGRGRVRGNSMSSGSGFSNSPQPTLASNSPFNHTLVHVLSRTDGTKASPTCIAPLGSSGETFVVSYSDAAVIVYDTKTGEQVGFMDSLETYDGTNKTSVNAVVATTIGLDQGNQHHGTNIGGEEDPAMGGPTGGGRSMAGSGVEGTIISGHEDRFVRFFDANSGK